jgi:hypothetical protein
MNPAKEAAEKICHMTGDYPVKTERYEVIIVAAYAPLLQKARELAEQITSPVRGQFFIPRDLELARELLALLRTTSRG